MADLIRTERSDAIATIWLDNPPVNAVSIQMLHALHAAFDEIERDQSVRCVVLSGAGERAFCAGADLRDDMMNLEAPAEERGARLAASFDSGINALMRDLAAFNRPKIAAVNGAAVGGGAGLALAADIVIAADSAYFALPFTLQLGLVPDMGVSWYLARALGRARAVGLSLLGDRLPATVAAEWGLIWRAVPDAALAEEATSVAARLAAGPPLAMAALTACIDTAAEQSLSAQLDFERDTQATLVRTEDFLEGVRAFREKRPPQFGGVKP